MKRKVQNLSDLRHEQALLRLQKEAKEAQLSESWAYLKQNYKGMVWNEVNPLKNSSILSSALGLLQPGLLPVVAEVAKGTVKGNPVNLKVLGSAAKYAVASIGIKWLRNWIEKHDPADEDTRMSEAEFNEDPPMA